MKRHPNFLWRIGLLWLGVMSFAAACTTPPSDPATPTPAIPGPALVQFFTDP